MKYTTIKYCAFIGTVSLILASCVKDDVKNPLTNQGNTVLKVLEAPENKIFLQPFTDIQTLDLFSLRKDAATAADLNTATTVKLNDSPTLIANYNAANGTNYEPLPDSLITLDPAFVKTGATYTTIFNAGDFAKEFIIKLNGGKWDLAHKYALGLSIADAGRMKISGDSKDIVVLISIKNKYDGVYDLTIKTTGWAGYGIADGVTYQWPRSSGNGIGLVTASANSVTFYDYLRNDNLQPAFTAAGAPTAFGATTPKFTFDLQSNKLISVINTTPDDGRGRVLTLNSSVTNSRYDPNTKTVYAAYIMGQNGRPNQMIYDTLKFTGSR